MFGALGMISTKVRSIYIIVLTTLAVIVLAPVMIHNKKQQNKTTRTIVDGLGGIVFTMVLLQWVVALLRFIPPTMTIADKIPIA
jgi:uncharacterized membrane protein